MVALALAVLQSGVLLGTADQHLLISTHTKIICINLLFAFFDTGVTRLSHYIQPANILAFLHPLFVIIVATTLWHNLSLLFSESEAIIRHHVIPVYTFLRIDRCIVVALFLHTQIVHGLSS